MSKYNFQVTATIGGYIQRECHDDIQAEEIKSEIEDSGFSLDEFVPGTELDMENPKVIIYGENES